MNIAIPSDNLKALDILRFQASFADAPEADTVSENNLDILDEYAADNNGVSEFKEDVFDSAAEAGNPVERRESLTKSDSTVCTEADKGSGKDESGTAASEKGVRPQEGAENKAALSSVPEVISMDSVPLFSVSLNEPGADFEHGFLYFASEPQEDETKELPPADSADKPSPVRRTSGRSAAKKSDPMGEKEEAALKEELRQQDELRANEIYERMKIDRQIHEAKLQAMLADLQTELQRIWREAALRRRKMEDDLSKNWQKAVLGV